jgi:hypothetical protein
MARPNIQIDDIVREMNDEEYAALLASGWSPEGTDDQAVTQLGAENADQWIHDFRE